MQLDELKVYLNEVHNFIKITHLNFQSDKVKGLDRETLDDLKYHFEHTQGEILRKSMIISTVILLESEIDTYCMDFRKYKKLTIGYNDFKGDLLDKFKMFSSKLLQSDFNFQGTLWQDIVGLYEIRNSLVHNCGLVSDFGRRKTIESFVSRNKSFEIDDNERICISHQACFDSIKIVETFFNELTAFSVSIEYSSPWVYPAKYNLTQNAITVNGTEISSGRQTKNIYKRLLTKSESDSIYNFLKSIPYDTLKDRYENPHFYDGTDMIFRINGHQLKSKKVLVYMCSTPMTDTLENLVQRQVFNDKYKYENLYRSQ